MKKDIQINECIVVGKRVGDTLVMAKNRDRAYNPELEIVHELVDGVEVAYLRDMVTDWSEGINEYGIGILNTALMVGYDENEKKIVKKGGKPSKDGARIRKALTKTTIADAVTSVVKVDGGVKGHTLVSNPQTAVSIEMTSKHNPKIEIRDINNSNFVRTNHGYDYPDAGYTKGPDYLSSKMRKMSAEKVIEPVKDDPIGILKNLRKQLYKQDSPLNMRRDTPKMSTSSQLMLNLTDRVLTLHYFKSKVEKFNGVVNRLPENYVPKIKIEVEEIDL
jgi:hypothetical protein